MFLSAHEIAQSRERTLNNLLELSTVCLQASQQLSAAFSLASRESIRYGSQHWPVLGEDLADSPAPWPAMLWLEHTSRAGRAVNHALAIVGEIQKAIIRSAEAQVRILDAMAFATINRANRSSPWETRLALTAMKTSLQSAEDTLGEISEVAIETVKLAENEIHQVTQWPEPR